MGDDTLLFELVLFDPENTLISLLESGNIEFKKIALVHKSKVAKDETIEIFSNDDNEALIPYLALLFNEWNDAKQFRKMHAQLNDGSIVYIHDCNIEEINETLMSTLKITAFDPEYNNVILKNR